MSRVLSSSVVLGAATLHGAGPLSCRSYGVRLGRWRLLRITRARGSRIAFYPCRVPAGVARPRAPETLIRAERSPRGYPGARPLLNERCTPDAVSGVDPVQRRARRTSGSRRG